MASVAEQLKGHTLFKTLTIFILAVSAMLGQGNKTVVATNIAPVDQHELAKLVPSDQKVEGAQACGPYFAKLTPYPMDDFGVLFEYKTNGPSVSIRALMANGKFATTIDDTKKVPTAEIISPSGAVGKASKVIIRISTADYKSATGCLPKPTK